LDILCGYLAGATMGFLLFKIYQKVRARYFPV
jgi:undecaprenyl-diphosphatase